VLQAHSNRRRRAFNELFGNGEQIDDCLLIKPVRSPLGECCGVFRHAFDPPLAHYAREIDRAQERAHKLWGSRGGLQGSVMAKQATRPGEWDAGVLGGAMAASLGRVVATDKAAALDKAVDEFRIDAARRFRLIAEPVE